MSKEAEKYLEREHPEMIKGYHESRGQTGWSFDQWLRVMQAFHEDQLAKKLEAVTDEMIEKKANEYHDTWDEYEGYIEGSKWLREHLKPKK